MAYEGVVVIDMKSKTVLVLLVFTVLPFNIFANDGFYNLSQATGSFYPIEDSNVSMISENIYITIEFDLMNSSIFNNNLIVIYDCTYTFKNHSDEAVAAQMGYPIALTSSYLNLDDMTARKEYSTWDFSYLDFYTDINGERMESNLEDYQINPSYPNLDYDKVFIFDIDFDPQEEKTVRNKLVQRVHPSFSAGILAGGGFNINYVFQTGRLWERPIEQAVLHVEILGKPELFSINQVNYIYNNLTKTDSATILEFKFTDFVPTKDFYMDLSFRSLSDFSDNEIRQLRNYAEEIINNRNYEEISLLAFFLNELDRRRPEGFSDQFLRKVFFWAGNARYFEQDYGKAEAFFKESINYGLNELNPQPVNFDLMAPYHVLGFAEDIFTLDMFLDVGFSQRLPSDSPEYYSAYNIAAISSLSAKRVSERDFFEQQEEFVELNLNNALKWLGIAYNIRPDLIGPLMESDSDLDYLKQELPREFNQM
jgi:hypothetical protein